MTTLHVAIEPKCQACGEAIEYRNPSPVGGLAEWLHVGEGGWTRGWRGGREGWRGHCAEPIRTCGDCGGPLASWEDAWANYEGCKACGTSYRSSIGD